MRYFISRTDDTGVTAVPLPGDDTDTKGIATGDRIMFYQLRGADGDTRGVFVSWGEVERLDAGGEAPAVQLKAVLPLKRRVPFSDLRGDPRRRPDAAVQSVPAEVFNQVLARSRR